MWLFYKVWFTKLYIFYKTELINSEFLQYFHTFYHKSLFFCFMVILIHVRSFNIQNECFFMNLKSQKQNIG